MGTPPSPLAGLRVLDLADESAAFAGRILADLGADVILVEPPGGSATRALAPYLEGLPDANRSLHHLYLDAGKRSIVLDLASPDGRSVFRSLVATSDALIETAHPPEASRLGLDHQALAAVNPALVHVSVTPFGRFAAWSNRRGSDLTAAAAGGLLYQSGEAAGPPVQGAGNPSYRMAGLTAAAAIMVALTARDRAPGSRGTQIDISVQECTRMTILEVANPNLLTWFDHVPDRPYGRSYRCADGKWVGINVRPDRFEGFLAWAAEDGVETDLVADDWPCANVDAPPERRARVTEVLERLAAAAPRDEFVRKALDTEQMCLPVLTFPDLREEKHLRVNRQFIPVRHEPFNLDIEFPRSPVAGVTTAAISRAPLLDEHGAGIRREFTEREAPRPRTTQPFDAATPLAGIRVVDFTWVFAGPLGTRILANLGAEVLKIESRARIDSIRNEVHPPGKTSENVSATFNQANTGKKSVLIDTSTAEGKQLIRRLVANADVVVNNYRPGVMEKLGFGYADLSAINPGIVMVNLPGCGREGPWARIGTMGNLLMGASGLNALTGFPDTPPIGVGTALPDFVVPYITVTTALAALRERRRTGRGQELDINQLSAAISLPGVEWLDYVTSGVEPARRANRDPNYAPHGVYPAAGDDRWVAIAVSGDDGWQRFCEAIGRSDLRRDTRFTSHADRKANEDALDDIVREWTSAQDRWEAAALLQSHDIPAAAVEDLRDTMHSDPQLRDHFQVVGPQPDEPDLAIVVDAEAIRFFGLERSLQRAPSLGEHTESVLRQVAGVSEEEYDRLILVGVIR